ncbi:hypothetical protein D3C87_1671880 [compost metagenome]
MFVKDSLVNSKSLGVLLSTSHKPNVLGFSVGFVSESRIGSAICPVLISKGIEFPEINTGFVDLTLSVYPIPAGVPGGITPFT